MLNNSSIQNDNGLVLQNTSTRKKPNINQSGLIHGTSHNMLARQSITSENMGSMSSIRTVSKEVFREYDKFSMGEITDMSIGQMLRDIYKLINTNYEPTTQDISEFKALLDIDYDEKLTRSDIESNINKYLSMVQGLPDVGNGIDQKNRTITLESVKKDSTFMNTNDGSYNYANFGDSYSDGAFYRSMSNYSPGQINAINSTGKHSKFGTFDFSMGQENAINYGNSNNGMSNTIGLGGTYIYNR